MKVLTINLAEGMEHAWAREVHTTDDHEARLAMSKRCFQYFRSWECEHPDMIKHTRLYDAEWSGTHAHIHTDRGANLSLLETAPLTLMVELHDEWDHVIIRNDNVHTFIVLDACKGVMYHVSGVGKEHGGCAHCLHLCGTHMECDEDSHVWVKTSYAPGKTAATKGGMSA